MKRRFSKLMIFRWLLGLAIMGIFLTLALQLHGKHYFMFSFMILFSALLLVYWRFEHQPIKTTTLMFMATLIALAVIGRLIFAAIPSFQAASFVIIMGGMALGPELGFVVGATTALVSNLFLGQGPWTPWQMFAWGLMGFTAALIAHTVIGKRRLPLAIFGGLWGFGFGWLMDAWYVLAYVQPLTGKAFLTAALVSVKFDAYHAAANVIFLILFANLWQQLFQRLNDKYDFLPTQK
ncbi:metal ion ABC superfamily ATP binding cassette transporter, membrane-spanning subunit [Lentilactobacillus farraginis DSM 18382 = JCM 14108]|uniref:Metal ion ABC superfamily ATP binding cassette transporter, membrane-spanning subunit n=3 Tax=Lentilactobacillus farraginis TaxID=390841 RepID=A0A0R1VTQ5_9LACO|nr:metal ion ABC superfamily ATP binding cassette transporter, membrane-spanning subunit [Lentilactobacillus farraginis DSM 18382 = JCM 14108]